MAINKDDRSLFGQMCEQSLTKQYEEDIKKYADESAKCSRRHYKRLEKITGIKLKGSRTLSGKAVLLILAAAIALLTACAALIYSDKIGEFFAEFYDDYINVGVSAEGQEENPKITEWYVLSYVPEGFELDKETKTATFSHYVWENSEGKRILYRQMINWDDTKFNTNNATTIETMSFDFKVYYYQGDDTDFYFWKSYGYYFKISSNYPLDEALLNEMIGGVVLD